MADDSGVNQARIREIKAQISDIEERKDKQLEEFDDQIERLERTLREMKEQRKRFEDDVKERKKELERQKRVLED